MNALFSTVEVDTLPRTSKNARGFANTMPPRSILQDVFISLSFQRLITLPFLYDMAAKTQEIYKTLWQYEMSDEEAAAMLAAVPVA